MRRIAILFAAAALAGCGKDPFAGRGKDDGGKRTPLESKVLATNAENFDRGLVAAYEGLVAARQKRDAAAWKKAFSGSSEADGLFEESTDPVVARIHHQYVAQNIDGDRASLTVKEIIEERDEKGSMNNTNVTVKAGLLRVGGEWKFETLKAEWK